MQLFPKLTVGLLNGWIFLLVYGIIFGGVVKSFPKDVVARLYDTSNWTPVQKTFTRVCKVFGLIIFVLVALTPLSVETFAFWLGSAIFVLGMIGVVIALFDFRHTPADRPATQGLYKISRNPQWVMLVLVFLGTCIAVGSWTACLFWGISVVCAHFRILAEEGACLAQYGDAYRDYMRQIPRYFVFF
ncbi:MAG: DUF1295 domain-containing protein [Anaerolineae bacterium]|nr:DUF1295 domain-containing protein [Anaerolineae bacterium]